MSKLVSINYAAEKGIPKNYVFPPQKRPGNLVFDYEKANVPVVDLHDHKDNTIQHLIKAGQDFGLFQVINHGVARELMDEAMEVFKEVFDLPLEEKSKINIEEGMCRFYTSSYNYETERTHYWRDALRHSCSPLEECIKYWPQKPEKYREIVKPYVVAVKDLGSRILELITQGLGLERGYLVGGELSKDDFLTMNHYPPCPDPRLTLGLSKHTDPNLLTVLQLGQVPGLQLFKDGQWMGVETLPNALLIIIGSQLEVVSNGRLRGAMHRAVTNAREARTSAAFFINPSMDCVIEPAKPLLDQPHNNLPLYKSYQYKDFLKVYRPTNEDKDGVLDAFKM